MSTSESPRTEARRVEVAGRHLEVVDAPGTGSQAAPLVFLHEGLGCIRLWRSFPERIATATGRRVVVYSRAGYGASDPVELPRSADYMHHEALEVLPALLDKLEIDRPLLVGHSDGASIALIHAGGSNRTLAGLALLAPHLFVEEHTLGGIRDARRAYLEDGLRARLARYHADVDNAFWGWNDVWLSPGFVRWSIEEYLPRIISPILAIQGEDDRYGTLEQLARLQCLSSGSVTIRLLAGCGHSPHLERPEPTFEALVSWLSALR